MPYEHMRPYPPPPPNPLKKPWLFIGYVLFWGAFIAISIYGLSVAVYGVH